MVPGKPQMTIAHVLKNTGKKDIVTTVYCHNFLTLSPGSEHMAITAPFNWRAAEPLQPDLVKLDGKTIRYLAPIPKGVTTQSLMNGFGDKVSDYDFIIFDMPPVGQTSITSKVARFMDMVLMVIESNKTDRDVARRAGALLAESKATVATVLNKQRRYVPAWLQADFH